MDMKNFLDTVNACTGKVNMLCSDGKRVNINREDELQGSLWQQFLKNKNSLRIILDIGNPKDEYCFILCGGLLICITRRVIFWRLRMATH